jgi:hypothetical protein
MAHFAWMLHLARGGVVASVLIRGVAERPLVRLRLDLLLQIGPAVSDLKAGYILIL